MNPLSILIQNRGCFKRSFMLGNNREINSYPVLPSTQGIDYLRCLLGNEKKKHKSLYWLFLDELFPFTNISGFFLILCLGFVFYPSVSRDILSLGCLLDWLPVGLIQIWANYFLSKLFYEITETEFIMCMAKFSHPSKYDILQFCVSS